VGDESLYIKEWGTVSIKLAWSKIRLHNTLFISNLGANLVSSSRIVLKSFYIIYDDKLYIIMRCLDNQVMFQVERLNNNSL
jgi:hypothetical protein